MVMRRSAGSVAEAYCRWPTTRGAARSPHLRQVDGQTQQIGPVRERRQRPGEGQRELILVRGVLALGQVDHHVLEGQQHPGVHFQGQVQVERTVAAFLGMQVHFPGLAQGIGLHEVPLVVHVEPVVHGMVLELSYVSSDVDDRHPSNPTRPDPLPGRVRSSRYDGQPVHRPLGTLETSSTRWSARWRPAWRASTTGGWRAPATGQYRSDLIADRAALEVIERAGLGALSEESGLHSPERPVWVVLDPVDGSTNASRGLPWWATSACAIDADGPLAAVVANQATGVRFEASRGGGRPRRRPAHQRPPRASRCARPSWRSPATRGAGWAGRSTGSSARPPWTSVRWPPGRLTRSSTALARALAPWDYLGGLLICQEAGAVVSEAFGRDLVVAR